MVDIVNVVASGSLGVELDLEVLHSELGAVSEYDPETYPGLYVRLMKDVPLITVYRTGKFIITGSKSIDESYTAREKFLEKLVEIHALQSPNDQWFKIQNLVCVDDLDRSVDLGVIAVSLGIGQTEYEPEQFPGLIYRPDGAECVLLVFSKGSVVITGTSDLEVVEREFGLLFRKIRRILDFEI